MEWQEVYLGCNQFSYNLADDEQTKLAQTGWANQNNAINKSIADESVKS